MKDIKKAGFICFGEVNTPYERLAMKHDRAVELLVDLQQPTEVKHISVNTMTRLSSKATNLLLFIRCPPYCCWAAALTNLICKTRANLWLFYKKGKISI